MGSGDCIHDGEQERKSEEDKPGKGQASESSDMFVLPPENDGCSFLNQVIQWQVLA